MDIARFVTLLLSSCVVGASRLIISRPGTDVALICTCLKKQHCHLDTLRWTRLHRNGTVEVINTDCQENTGRFCSKAVKDSEIRLTVSQLELHDAGRYYCSDKLNAHSDFSTGGTLLHIGDENFWTNKSKISLLFERLNDSSEHQRLQPRSYAVLRCLVTGLGAPLKAITWRSSRGKSQTGQILELKEANNGFQVMSQLQIPVPISYQLYYKKSDPDQDNNSSENNVPWHEPGNHGADEWWCEVHTGEDKVYRSNVFSLSKRNQEDPGSEWCTALSHAAIALSTVCVILLLILISHWLCHLRTRPSPDNNSPLSDTQGDQQAEGTYAQLDFKPPESKSGKQRRDRCNDTQDDTSVYSGVKCSEPSTANTSPLSQIEDNQQPEVTYSHLNFKQPSESKSGRRHRETPVNTQEETSLYSRVKCG